MTLERLIAAVVGFGLLAGLFILVRQRRQNGVRSNDPATVFMAIWGGGLLLYAVPVIDYVSTPVATWLVVYGSIGAFLTGAWLAHRRGGVFPSSPPERKEELSTLRINVGWLATGGLSLLGFLFFLHGIDVTVGWQTLFTSPGAARAAQDLPQFQDAYGPGKALSYLAPVSLLLWTVAFRDHHFKGGWRLVAPGVIFVVLPYFLIGERLSLLFAVVWIIAFHFVWRPVGDPRRIALGGVALIVAGLSFFYVIGNQKGSTLETYPEVRNAVTSSVFEPIALPYMYATANVPVLGQLMQDPLAPTTYGQLSARPVSTVAHRILPVSGNPPEQGGFYGIPFSSYNSATWLDPFFRDFGVLGALVLPGLFGFLATMIFLIARRRRTLVSSWLAAIGLAFVVFSPLKSLAPDALTWELLALAPLVGLFISADARARLRSSATSLQSRIPLDNRLIAAIAGAAVLVAFGLALFALQQGASETRPGEISFEKLQRDATKVVDSYDTVSPTSDGPEGDTQSVTSRLTVSDTGTRYLAMPDSKTAPSQPGTIGVFADGGVVYLRTLTNEGRVQVARVIEGEDGFKVLAPKVESRPGGAVTPPTEAKTPEKSSYKPGLPGLPAAVLAVAFLLTAIWSLARLPTLHPLQLWSVPWAIASFTFALGLLPFIEVSWLAIGLILGATAALGLGVAGGEHLYSRQVPKPKSDDVEELEALLRPAALMSIGLTAILLLAFIVQLGLRFGLVDALVTNSDVRRAIGEGAFPITVKYIYANLAAIALTGAMAGLTSRTRVSRGWLGILLLVIAATYFTTARSNIFLAVVVAVVAYFMFRQRWPSWKSVTAGVTAAIAFGLVLFVVLGSLVGKEVNAYPEFQEVPNFFQNQGVLTRLAIPYRYLSSSIPAFELQVHHSSLAGQTHGCAMFTEACDAVEKTGLNVDPVPRVKAFTAPFFEWNTFTALDLPLIDFGKLFLIPIFALIGGLVGLSWAAARRSRSVGGIVYSLLAACLVGGYSTFFFTAPHMIGAGLIAVGCLGIASFRRRSRERSSAPETRYVSDSQSLGKPDAPSGSGSGDYRPALDGVRAAAVIMVIIYHLGHGWRAGFLGVDVFFVLSGYLITTLLLRERIATGRVHMGEFWMRRARRLLPALLLLVAACALVAAITTPVVELTARRDDMLSTLFYVANWHFIAADASYFEAFLGASPLRHMWSLAIEEQFYVLWPLVLLGALWFARGRRSVLLALLGVGILVSTILMALSYDVSNPSRAYFGTETHAFPLLIGAALAVTISMRPGLLSSAVPRRLAGLLWPVVFTALLLAVLILDDQQAFYYRGGLLLFALGVATALWIIEALPRSLPGRALSWRPVCWIGMISYGLYLWHWPLFVWIGGPHVADAPLSTALVIAATVLAATLSFYLVERPVRQGRIRWIGKSHRRLVLALAGAFLLVAGGTALGTRIDPSDRLAKQVNDIGEAPCPAGSPSYKGQYWCRLVSPARPTDPTIATAGDSTIRAMDSGLSELAAKRGWGYVQAGQNRCSALAVPFGAEPDDAAATAFAESCAQTGPHVLEGAVRDYDPDLWFLSDRWPLTATVLPDGTFLWPREPQHDRLIVSELRVTLKRLSDQGGKIAVLAMLPIGPPVECANDSSPEECKTSAESREEANHLNGLLRKAVEPMRGTAAVVSLSDIVCPQGSCLVELDGTLIRYDGIHFTEGFSRMVAPELLRRTKQAGLEPRASTTG